MRGDFRGRRLNAILFILLTLVTIDGGRAATAPADIVAGYVEVYWAAMQRGDLAAAETAAAAGLEASMQAHGNGGRTAELALDLAGARIAQGKHAEAIAPAHQALELAESRGAASGIDVNLARLIAARADLRIKDRATVTRLEQRLAEAATEPDLVAECYVAAMDLAQYAVEQRRYDVVQNAWATAARLMQRAGASPVLLARIQVEQAAAGIMELATRERSVNRAGTRVTGLTDAYEPYLAQLAQMITTLAPLATVPGPTPALTEAQEAFGRAWAWHDAVQAKFRSEDRQWSGTLPMLQGDSEIGASRYALPACEAENKFAKSPVFPRAERVVGGVGAIVLKLKFAETGALEHWAVAGAVGGDAFTRSVTDVVGAWSIARKNPDETGCRLERERFLSVMYILH